MKAIKCVTLVGATLIITGVMLSLPVPLVGQGRVSVSDEVAVETPARWATSRMVAGLVIGSGQAINKEGLEKDARKSIQVKRLTLSYSMQIISVSKSPSFRGAQFKPRSIL